MKEIKFREWDEDAEYMFYSDKPEDDYFFEFKDGKLLGFVIRPPKGSDDPMEPPEPYTEDFPVELSTGLKDKNGTERCDNDIIRRNTGYVFVEKKKWFGLGTSNNAKAYGYDYHPEDEIIGTIHENKELLDG